MAGAVLGASAGAIGSRTSPHSDRIKSVLIGTVGGLAVGSVAGHIVHQQSSRSKEDDSSSDPVPAPSGGHMPSTTQSGSPTLLPARTEAFFVDDQVRNNVFIPAHFEYRIVEPARWSK